MKITSEMVFKADSSLIIYCVFDNATKAVP